MNPIFTNNFIDSCAFDPNYDPEDKAALRLHELRRRGVIELMIAHSTMKEIDHPNTPAWVKNEASRMIYTEEVNLTLPERERLRSIESVLAGDGKIENIKEDAKHIFECQKYGRYFITTDARILKKRDDLRNTFSVIVCKPSEFLELIEKAINK